MFRHVLASDRQASMVGSELHVTRTSTDAGPLKHGDRAFNSTVECQHLPTEQRSRKDSPVSDKVEGVVGAPPGRRLCRGGRRRWMARPLRSPCRR